MSGPITPRDWIIGRDTGLSSMTIWEFMTGLPVWELHRWSGLHTPRDPSDFGRCYRLLQHFPEWRSRLPEMAEAKPEWAPLVAAWDELVALYEEELPSGRAPKLYERMQELHAAVMIAAGWAQTGPNSWQRQKSEAQR